MKPTNTPGTFSKSRDVPWKCNFLNYDAINSQFALVSRNRAMEERNSRRFSALKFGLRESGCGPKTQHQQSTFKFDERNKSSQCASHQNWRCRSDTGGKHRIVTAQNTQRKLLDKKKLSDLVEISHNLNSKGYEIRPLSMKAGIIVKKKSHPRKPEELRLGSAQVDTFLIPSQKKQSPTSSHRMERSHSAIALVRVQGERCVKTTRIFSYIDAPWAHKTKQNLDFIDNFLLDKKIFFQYLVPLRPERKIDFKQSFVEQIIRQSQTFLERGNFTMANTAIEEGLKELSTSAKSLIIIPHGFHFLFYEKTTII